MEFNEIYCSDCKKIIGRYNVRFYAEDKVNELMNVDHSHHVRNGHQVAIRKFEK